jgi:uncharacterized surface protein with fasciclin (FAS1) repeats
MKLQFLLLIGTLCFFSCNTSQREDDNRTEYSEANTEEGVPSSDDIESPSDFSQPDQDLMSVVAAIPELESFANSLLKTNSGRYFDQGEKFTVFAPTNDAFQEYLKKNPQIAKAEQEDQLQALLQYHITSLYSNADDFKDEMNFESLQGENLRVRVVDQQILINEAEVIEPDVIAQNGVIHIIDQVLVPETFTATNQQTME